MSNLPSGYNEPPSFEDVVRALESDVASLRQQLADGNTEIKRLRLLAAGKLVEASKVTWTNIEAIPSGGNDVSARSPKVELAAERERREKAVEAIFEDLRDRKFLKWLFCEDPEHAGPILFENNGIPLMPLSADIQDEIRREWQEIIRKVYEAGDGIETAPELYEALDGLMKSLNMEYAGRPVYDAYQKGIAALAKARGEVKP